MRLFRRRDHARAPHASASAASTGWRTARTSVTPGHAARSASAYTVRVAALVHTEPTSPMRGRECRGGCAWRCVTVSRASCAISSTTSRRAIGSPASAAREVRRDRRDCRGRCVVARHRRARHDRVVRQRPGAQAERRPAVTEPGTFAAGGGDIAALVSAAHDRPGARHHAGGHRPVEALECSHEIGLDPQSGRREPGPEVPEHHGRDVVLRTPAMQTTAAVGSGRPVSKPSIVARHWAGGRVVTLSGPPWRASSYVARNTGSMPRTRTRLDEPPPSSPRYSAIARRSPRPAPGRAHATGLLPPPPPAGAAPGRRTPAPDRSPAGRARPGWCVGATDGVASKRSSVGKAGTVDVATSGNWRVNVARQRRSDVGNATSVARVTPMPRSAIAAMPRATFSPVLLACRSTITHSGSTPAPCSNVAYASASLGSPRPTAPPVTRIQGATRAWCSRADVRATPRFRLPNAKMTSLATASVSTVR